MIEELLEDVHQSDPRWRIACLRYFNPVGADPSGLIGDDPQGIPNNLMPFISQVACGTRPKLSVFGDDYPTPDGTGVCDYIHVVDLAAGHLAALNYLQGLSAGQWLAVSLGTGNGVFVLDMIKAFETESGQAVPYEVVARRPGDIAACYADAHKAKQLFNREAKLGLRDMCADTWRWQSNSPHGYGNVGCTEVMNETRLALALGAQLGEGLHWDASTQRLWGVAYRGAGCISCFAPDVRLLRRIGVPASNVTDVGFAGPGFDRLFVATARFGLAGAAQQAQPQAGDLFEVLEPGVTGLPSLSAGLGWA